MAVDLTGQRAFSCGHSEVMSLSELRKDVKLAQCTLEFCGTDLLPIKLHTDADVARTFCCDRGLGRTEHVDVGHCWLESEPRNCNSIVMRRDRKFNARLAHSPSTNELRKVSFHVQMPQHDSEDGKLPCCQNDAETDVCTENRGMPHENRLRARGET